MSQALFEVEPKICEINTKEWKPRTNKAGVQYFDGKDNPSKLDNADIQKDCKFILNDSNVVINPLQNKITDDIYINFAEIKTIWHHAICINFKNAGQSSAVSEDSSPGFMTKIECKVHAWETMLHILETQYQDQKYCEKYIKKIKLLLERLK